MLGVNSKSSIFLKTFLDGSEQNNNMSFNFYISFFIGLSSFPVLRIGYFTPTPRKAKIRNEFYTNIILQLLISSSVS